LLLLFPIFIFSSVSPGSFLSKDNHLRQLVEQARRNTELLQAVHQWLPAPLHLHCPAAHVQEGQLVLYTDSPAWVMRLRFSSPQLLEGLRKTVPNLRGVRVRVQLAQPVRQRQRRRPTLPQSARDLLRETASSVDNPKLRAALERLSQSAKQRK
jgi:hypothetical protein